ncbi:mandelate racemase/muconate lactonizing enzyme family protein [Macrococcoides caseolyticum]|uniref:mandelate racemase/muconate lactonizing enzyme family protein n=1 Tax=Macrococcoides caseolyticum TaxID=69966 RepID=UPI001F2DD14B|nr:dipeptide epimerase [Macrococcus caseolyticus]MCE4956209.1 dipeptide epimerase [Macrococcus caseolyticus]
MKITKIKGYYIKLPLKEPFIINYATYDSMHSVIVELTTDNGIVGYGEGVADEHVTGESAQGVYSNLELLAPHLIGKNPLNIEAMHQFMDECIVFNPALKAAIDIALYDILGKHAQLPIYQLLGGKTVDTLDYAKVLSVKNIKETKKDIDLLLAQGYKVIKIKLGGKIQDDILKLKQILSYIKDTDATIRVDCNQAWSHPKTIIQAVNSIDDPKLKWIEQPLKYNDIAGMKYLFDHLNVPLMADEMIRNVDDLARLNTPHFDLLNVKLMKCGGIHNAVKIIRFAEALGIECQIGSMVESSIGSAAGYHTAMALKNVLTTELTGPLLFSQDIGDLNYQIPFVELGEAPGLGININTKILEQLTVKQFELE